MEKLNFKAEVLKVYPDARLDYYIDLHCDYYYYIVDGKNVISEVVPHYHERIWKSAYERINNKS